MAVVLLFCPHLRRRRNCPPRFSLGAWDGPVGRPLQRGRRPPRLRRLQDVRIVISKLLIANRGEIAARIIRSARAMNIATVALYCDADRDAPYVLQSDEVVHLAGAAPADTYLRSDLVLEAAARTGADAVHPGYGFLSENADFSRASAEAAGGLLWR